MQPNHLNCSRLTLAFFEVSSFHFTPPISFLLLSKRWWEETAGMGVEGRREVVVVCGEKMSAGITIWDLETGEELMRIPTCASPPRGFLCIKNHLLVASQLQKHRQFGGGAVFFWPLNKPQAPQRSYPMEAIGPIASSKDGIYLAGGAPSGNVYIWEVPSGRLLKNWHAHQKSTSCLTFFPDDSFLISGSEDGIICVWSMISVLDVADPQACQSFSPFHIWSEHGSSITGLSPVCDGANLLLISSSLDGTCKVWDLILGRVLQTHVFSGAVTAMVVDPGEQLLFSGNEDGRIHVTELNIGLQENPTVVSEDDSGVLCGHKETITALAFSSGGLWLISASKDCTACLWDVKTWHVVRKFSHGKCSIINLLVIPQFSLSVSENNRNCQRPRASQLDKAPQLNTAPQGTVAFLPTYCSQEDHVLIPSFRTSRLTNRHILDLEQGRTQEAIQLKVEACVENRQLAVRMTKNMVSINKVLQSRLLDLMQLRLRNASKVAFSGRRVQTNGPEETRQHPE
ncbi:protein ROOT INITIATION DEFECTIVE 3 isoform X1 [Elaeis guineensis]|uniref:Protein ROOT INITIATION DEFECTIVE 3 isoform X1 n=1 Tax=Elaeis guineensis var. tenera TaxID=51953 RepID=A0A6I9RPA8_ELAGV|nr:protein ROOT INITIATION DEFECTIVE 3 isoform X1 [Elaeis guineensis]